MATHTPDEPTNTDTDGIVQLGKDSNDKTQIVNANPNVDSNGKEAFKTVFGETPIVIKRPTTLVNVVYGKGTAKIIETTANGGTITSSESMLIASSSVNPIGTAKVESEHAVRYTPGEEFYSYFSVLFADGVIGANQFSGPYSETDGFIIGFKGTQFCIIRRDNSVDFPTNQEDFNKDKLDGTGKSEFTLDPTKLNQFRITFGWLGTSNIYFQVFTAEKGWVFFHEIQIAGTQTTPHIRVPYLPVTLEVTKTSGITDVIAKSGSWNSGIMGEATIGISDILHSESIPETSLASGTETPLISLRGLDTLNGVKNRIEVVLLHWSLASDGVKPVRFRIYRNSVLAGGAWTPHEAGISVIEVNTTATLTTPGDEILPSTLGRTDSKDLNIEHLRIDIHRGDTITITALSSNPSDVLTGIAWREEF